MICHWNNKQFDCLLLLGINVTTFLHTGVTFRFGLWRIHGWLSTNRATVSYSYKREKPVLSLEEKK